MMKKKRFIYTLSLWLLTLTLISQRPIQVDVILPQPYPYEFAAYFNNPANIHMVVINHTDAEQEVFFLGELIGIDNGVVARTLDTYRPSQSIILAPNEIRMFDGEEIANINMEITADDIELINFPASELHINGVLPEGTYAFCIKAYNYNSDSPTPLSVGCSTTFPVTYGNQLRIINPSYDGVVIEENEPLIIQWDPTISGQFIGARDRLEYEVKMINLSENPGEPPYELFNSGSVNNQLQVENLNEERYIYSSDDSDLELDMGEEYAVRVRVIDPDNEIPFENDGYSEIRTFWYGEVGTIDDAGDPGQQDLPECIQSIYYDMDGVSTSEAQDASSFEHIDIGNFVITDLELSSVNGGTISGTGEVAIPMLLGLKVAVSFSGIKVNSEGRVFQGLVTAIDESNDEYTLSDINSNLSSIENYVEGAQENMPIDILGFLNEHVTSVRMVEALLSGNAPGMPIGFTDTIAGQFISSILTEMTFQPDQAKLSMINIFDFTSLGDEFIVALGGKDIKMTPTGIGGEHILHQVENQTRNGFGGLQFVTYGGSGTGDEVRDNYSYIEFDCDGLKGLAIRGEVVFPRDMIVPDLNGEVVADGNVKAVFNVDLLRGVEEDESAYAGFDDDQVERISGLQTMIDVTFDPFQLPGLEGWSFETSTAYLDLSDLENPEGITFPEEYEFDLGDESEGLSNLWRGFYLQDLNLLTPGEYQDGIRSSVGIENIIIDPALSLEILAKDLINKNTGDFDGWGFSLDTIGLKIVQNTFINGRIEGKINTPIMGTDDYLTYRGIIDKNENDKYRFSAITSVDTVISIPIAIANAGLCPNSYIAFRQDEGQSTIETFIKGQLAINVTDQLPEDFVSNNVIPDLEVRLADFQLNYNSQDGFITDMSEGKHCSFGFGLSVSEASCGTYSGPAWQNDYQDYGMNPDSINSLLTQGFSVPSAGDDSESGEVSNQENISGFPISFRDPTFNFEGNEVSIGFGVDLSLSAGEMGISAGADISLVSQLQLEGIKVKRFKLTGLELGCAYLSTSIDPISLGGTLCLIDENGNKGFTGGIHIGMESFQIDLLGGFGKQGTQDDGDYGTDDYYGWWFIDGMLRASPIAQISIVQLNGLGGGIYWNVLEPEIDPVLVESAMESGDDSGPPAILPVPTPVPSFGTRTIIARVSASLVSEQVMLLDPSISATFDNTGLRRLSIDGRFWMLSPGYSGRHDARLYGSSTTNLDFEDVNGTKKVNLWGNKRIYANIIPQMLYGSGVDEEGEPNLLLPIDFALGDEYFYPDKTSNSDDDNIFWFFHAGNPYQPPLGDGIMGGMIFNIPGFNMQDDGGENNAAVSAGIESETYFMVGQDVPNILPPEPPALLEMAANLVESSEEGSFEGGGIPAEPEERAPTSYGNDPSNGNGLAFGTHIRVFAEVNAVIYASLNIIAGVDILLSQDETRSCFTEEGNAYNPPGVNGWYGMGRAYAGLDGRIGAKGKIFGKEIDVNIMTLTALMMLEAGGPNPFWLDGYAALNFNLLGGTIKGNARMNISVGERCVPPVTSPFEFPIIAETYPNAGEDDEIDPDVTPSVSFTVPVNKIMYIPDVDGETTHRIKPVFREENFTVLPDENTQNVQTPRHDSRYEMVQEEGRIAVYNPSTRLSGLNLDERRKRWVMNVRVTASEWDGSRWNPMYWNGELWEERVEVPFRTARPSLEMEDDDVAYTTPLRDQRFYLQDERSTKTGFVTTFNDESSYYFTNEDYQGRECTYEAILKELDSNREIDRRPFSYVGTANKGLWFLPSQLDNNKEYFIQIIRNREGYDAIVGDRIFERRQLGDERSIGDANNEEGISVNYTVEPELTDLSALTSVRAGEELVYSWTFETSQYNTLAQKLNDVNVRVVEKDGFQRVNLVEFEGFDTYDIYGKDIDEVYTVEPRVLLSDPMTSPFVADVAKPVMTDFAATYIQSYEDQENGCLGPDLPSNPPSPPTGIGTIGSSTDLGQGNNVPQFESSGEAAIGYFNNLPMWTNFQWSNIDGVTVPLNERVHSGIIQQHEEDDNFTIRGEVGLQEERDGKSTGTHDSRGTMDNYIRISYYVTEHILQDAQQYVDFAEEQIDRTENGYNNYSQSNSSSWVSNRLMLLKNKRDAIIDSPMITGVIINRETTTTRPTGEDQDLTNNRVDIPFSNAILFRANKSYDSSGYDLGDRIFIDFQN